MNKLQRLKEQIQSLPAKKSRLNLVGVLQRYNVQTSETLEIVRQTRQNVEQVSTVFPNLDLQTTVTEKINSVARTAQSLRKTLEKIENIQTKKADDNFQLLNNTARTARNNLRDKWSSTLKERIETYDKLVKASSSANLRGSSSLAEKLERLRGQTDILPKTEDAALKVKSDLDGINTSFQDLGLEGKIGDFLIAAAAGRANAKILLDNDVREFIDQNQLWSALSVKIE